MAILETGFKKRSYDDILQDKISKAIELFGADIDVSELSPLGKYIRINAFDQALTEEEAEKIYYSIFPKTATGASLDRLCPFVGISRNQATYAKYLVLVKGTAGVVVPAGFLVGTASGINYSCESETTIAENGEAIIVVECVEVGEIGNVPITEITKIVNPATGIDSVSGFELMLKAQELESDYELRKRFDASKGGLGSCNEAAIKAALMRVPTVTHASVIVDDENGSFECFICGGENNHEDIANTIFDKKPMGIKTTGAISQEITDSSGTVRVINFSHTQNVNVYVRVALATTVEFEDTGKAKIKDNIETQIDNLGIGKSVILSSLYGNIYGVTGVSEVTELLLSTDGVTWNTNNVSIGTYENAVCCQVEIDLNGGGYGVV